MPRFHLGTWLTRTIVTPNGRLVVFGHGNAIWSAQINLFCKRFCHCFCFTLFFARYYFIFLLRFFKLTKFSTNQLTEHSSRQSGDYLPGLILVVNILLWINTVFITTRHGFIINRHNMEGVISTHDWAYRPYYKSWSTNDVIQCHRYDIFHIWLFLSTTLVINPGYMLGIMTRPAVNRQDTLNLLYAETGWIKHDHRCLLNR